MEVKNLPLFVNGTLCSKTWTEERRNEILDIFKHEVYGVIPDEVSLKVSYREVDVRSGPQIMGGRAIRKLIEVMVSRKGREFAFPFLVFIPNAAKKTPVPLILSLTGDSDPTRERISSSWPAETLIARGYAAAAINPQDITPDFDENFQTKFYRIFSDCFSDRPADAFGAISAWAWGMEKAVEYMRNDPMINGNEIGVIGHSRGGKTALWCGAQNLSIALTISNCSGCSGAALTRGKEGEHIRDITSKFGYWFCENYKKYADREDSMPFDQYMLLALIAPRLLYISSRTQDTWCDPKAEFASAHYASEVYEKAYGKKGLGIDEIPLPEHPVHLGAIGYHLKSGAHLLDEYNWDKYLDFCDLHFHPTVGTEN
jgi:hypothetical protein